jgi:membrane peptidoglycan carboxypeptidase
MLGPLTQVKLRATFDYVLSFDVDLARPDSVSFHADVVPHGLVLDPARTTLPLTRLDQPFTATIHLPKGRTTTTRLLAPENPHFRTLDQIDSTLVHAVVTNEDGGFFATAASTPTRCARAFAENLRAGAYRRGAGTITMQLARNLWLGHERTLSRKARRWCWRGSSST